MRHFQPAILVVVMGGKALDFVLPFPGEVTNDRINLFYFILRKADEKCTKHKFRYDICFQNLNFPKRVRFLYCHSFKAVSVFHKN